MSLDSIQHAFDLGRPEELARVIRERSPIGLATALDIFKNNVIGSALQALQAAYPVCLAVVGEDYFRQLARAHHQSYPLESNDLNRYGEHFYLTLHKLMQQHPELKKLAYLEELVKLENALHLAYYAEDAGNIDTQSFAALSDAAQSEAILRLAPGTQLLASNFDVMHLWAAHQAEIKQELSIDSGQFYSVVCRTHLKPTVYSISQDDYVMLAAIRDGLTLAQLIDRYPRINERLAQWIHWRWLSRYDHPPESGTGD